MKAYHKVAVKVNGIWQLYLLLDFGKGLEFRLR